MSDFDKEAEREKLRKKYERDKREREATQRMSDLLLKGATMTNTHCDTCHDPLFRQNGVTFCPTCHGSPEAVEGPDLEDDAADESAGEAGSVEGGVATEEADDPTAGSSDDSSGVGDVEPADPSSTVDDERAEPSPTRAGDEPDSSRSTDASGARHTTAPRRTPPSQVQSGRREGRARPESREGVGRDASLPVDGDLGTARTSLTAALEHFAREAAETDDPRYARDCLEAAREAAETLAVLGR